MSENTTTEQDEHRFEGVGEDTQVFCPDNGILSVSGDSFDPDFCPYCGESVTNANHRVDVEVCEVFCKNTPQSTWRFCPMCSSSKN